MEDDEKSENELYVKDTDTVDNGSVETGGDANESVNNENTDTPAKTYTQEDVDKIVEGRTRSLERKHKKDMEKQLAPYREMANVVTQGLETSDINEATSQLQKFYKDNGINIKPQEQKAHFDEDEEKFLAHKDADEVIALGEAEMTRRANELANIPKRSAREQEEFMILAENLTRNEAKKELKAKGVDESILDSNEFRKFASQFNSHAKVSDIYEMYAKVNGLKREQPKVMNSLENNASMANKVKDFYTKEEAAQFTVKDFDNNPALWKAVQDSASKWK